MVATTANGAPVHNLTADDFELFEDGVPQQVQTFKFVDLSSTSAIRPLPPGIASNEIEPGGLFVVVLDELGLQVDDVSQARRVADRFFKETLLPNDYVAIVRSGTDSGFFLTSDRTLALNTIPQTVGRRERNLGLEQPGVAAVGPATSLGTPTAPPAWPSSSRRLRRSAPAKTAARASGCCSASSSNCAASRHAARRCCGSAAAAICRPITSKPWSVPRGRDDDVFSKLIDTARAANVAIYTVDPRGLQTPAAEVGRDGEPFDTTAVRDLAGATGGRALLGNDPNAALDARRGREPRLLPAWLRAGRLDRQGSGRGKLTRADARARRVAAASAGLPAVDRGRDDRGEPDRVGRCRCRTCRLRSRPRRSPARAIAAASSCRLRLAAGLKDGTSVEYTVVALDPAGKIAGADHRDRQGARRARHWRSASRGRRADSTRCALRPRSAARPAAGAWRLPTVEVPEGKSKKARVLRLRVRATRRAAVVPPVHAR